MEIGDIPPHAFKRLAWARDKHSGVYWEEWDQGRLELNLPPNNDFLVTLAVDGHGFYRRDDHLGVQSNQFRPGLIGFTLPYERATASCDPVRIASFGVSFDRFRERLSEISEGRDVDLHSLTAGLREWPLLEALLGHTRTMAASPPLFSKIADSLLDVVCSTITQNGGLKASTALTDEGCLSPRHVRLVQEFIEENLDRKIEIAALANLTGYGSRHFSRLFHRTFAVSPYVYVQERRLLRARHMIASRQQSLTEIAFSCGFSGSSAFAAAFRKRFGVSPSRAFSGGAQ